ncbi:sigma-70 family RNA polymerase sigma factor [Cupriavidus pauculus]|uniref:Sigma-70 family RNA polymerase sigma factor n=2 Tax=Burkholderiaceae TaxID=119060 RepID=A0A5P2HD68_9BURK|nr:sigma-70 family RNA polymerase sigma factor [Cupriavidus pauculus]
MPTRASADVRDIWHSMARSIVTTHGARMPGNAGHTSIARTFIVHRRHLLCIATRILGCPVQAEDVLHDAYLKLIFHTPDGPWRSELSYICRVVRNLALDGYRRQQIERRLFASEFAEADAPLDTNSPDRIASARERERSLRDAMRALPPRTRDALTQYYFEDQSQRTIAARLGISPAMVSFILQDARDTLGTLSL